MQINNSISEYFWNEEFNVIDIKQSSNTNQLSVSDYILTLLLHNAFKSFDGGETFVGSIANLLTTDNAIQFQGNLKGVITNTSISEEQKSIIIDEVRTCLKTGIDEGIFTLASQDDILITDKGNLCYITLNIIVNKRRQSLVFYYNTSVNKLVLLKK